jgi:hypothetical protein
MPQIIQVPSCSALVLLIHHIGILSHYPLYIIVTALDFHADSELTTAHNTGFRVLNAACNVVRMG